MLDDGLPTRSSKEQQELETAVTATYASLVSSGVLARAGNDALPLRIPREKHVAYLQAGLGSLPHGFVSLEAGRPWLCFWILHALALLEAPLPRRTPASAIVHFLSLCQSTLGGFGGGPEQLPHLAPTYAAVAALVTLGTPEALAVVDRRRMQDFLLSMCQPPDRGGGVSVCEGGEVDVRGCYTAMAVAHMLRLDKGLIARRSGMVDFVRRCQTYEGGLGGEPGNEAHGGYTFCGVGALALVGGAEILDLPRLLRWVASCQGSAEGGFMGRTNKLVDGCYSYWQQALFPLVKALQQTLGQAQQADRSGPSPPPAGAPSAVVVPDLPASLLAAWKGERPPESQAAPTGGDRKKSTGKLRRENPASSQGTAAELCQPVSRPTPDPTRASGDSGRETGVGAEGSSSSWREAEPCAYKALALQLWLLAPCTSQLGGMRDKPGKAPDFYHTCYCLSGLAACQQHTGLVAGGEANRLAALDVPCNVVTSKLQAALAFFDSQGPV